LSSKKVGILFALYTIQERVGTFALQHGVLSPKQFDLIRQEVFEYCKLVRADCVPLVDAFNFSDFVVGSPMGRFDGDIYRHYFHTVTHARMFLSCIDKLTLFFFLMEKNSWCNGCRPLL